MSIAHAVHSLIEKYGSAVTVRSRTGGKQAQIMGILQNDTEKNLRHSFSYTLRGSSSGRLHVFIGTPEIPFELDDGAQIQKQDKFYQLLAHRYFYEKETPVYLYALLEEEVKEDELL